MGPDCTKTDFVTGKHRYSLMSHCKHCKRCNSSRHNAPAHLIYSKHNTRIFELYSVRLIMWKSAQNSEDRQPVSADAEPLSGNTGPLWLAGSWMPATACIVCNGITTCLLSLSVTSIWLITFGAFVSSLMAMSLQDCSMQLPLAGYAAEEITAHSDEDSGWDIWFLSAVDDTTSFDARNWFPPFCIGCQQTQMHTPLFMLFWQRPNPPKKQWIWHKKISHRQLGPLWGSSSPLMALWASKGC